MILRSLKTLKKTKFTEINIKPILNFNKHLLIKNFLKNSKLKRGIFLTTTSSLILLNLNKSKLKFYSDENLENLKKNMDSHIKNLKSLHGDNLMSFPQVNYRLQGETYKIDFLIDQRKCDIFSLLVTAGNMLEKSENLINNGKNPKIFDEIKTMEKNGNMVLNLEFTETTSRGIKYKGTIKIMGEFRPDMPSFKFQFEKTGDISTTDIQILKKIYELANINTQYSVIRERNIATNNSINRAKKSEKTSQTSKIASALGLGKSESSEETMKKLSEMGIILFMPNDKKNMQGLAWDMLAGYEKQKRDIEDTVLMSLTNPEIFDEITLKTRMRFEHNRAKAVLFEGPPGTGKTTSAKIIASQVGIPLLYMPLESIMSKWYGEAEQKLADIFEGAGNLGKAIIFIDEIDAIAGTRANG